MQHRKGHEERRKSNFSKMGRYACRGRGAAFNALARKMNTHQWSGVSPEELNAAATALGPAFKIVPPAYFDFTPAEFLRPFDRADAHRLKLD
jgi:hypothetical protein